MRMPGKPGPILFITALVAFIIALVVALNLSVLHGRYLITQLWLNPASARGEDFNHYYATAWLTLHGQIPYGIRFIDTPIAQDFNWNPAVPRATNPPALALVTAPMALLSPKVSWTLWTITILAFAVVSFSLILRHLGVDWTTKTKVLAGAMFVGSGPLIDIISYSQVQSLLVLLTIVGWISLRSNRPLTTGLIWGLATALKFFTWPLLLVLIASGKRKAFILGIAIAIALLSAPLVTHGSNVYTLWFEHGLPLINAWGEHSDRNISVSGTIHNIGMMFNWNVYGTNASRFIVSNLVPNLVCLVALALLWKRTKSVRDLDFVISIVATLSFLCAPVAWPNYLFVLLLPMGVAWTYSDRSWSLGAMLFVFWLLILTKHFELFQFHLLGVAVLLGCSLWIWKRATIVVPVLSASETDQPNHTDAKV